MNRTAKSPISPAIRTQKPTELQKAGLFDIPNDPQQSNDWQIEAAAVAVALFTVRRVVRSKWKA
jgi:hypothetical protein